MKTLVLATANPGKVAEFRELLDFADVSVLTPHDLGFVWEPPEETGATFAENAILKAQSLTALCGLPALADDSGLCVDALDGRPGVQSARWAGETASDEDRTDLLLAKLRDTSPAHRTARFICAVALATPDMIVHVEQGACEGHITELPRGASGFGYDPIFLIPALGRTFAELTSAQKNAISHRAAALRLLRPALLAQFSLTSAQVKFP